MGFNSAFKGLTHNLQAISTENRKTRQISVLSFEIKEQWQLKKIIVIPLVLSAMVDIPNMLNRSHSALTVPPHLLSQAQKVVLLNCSIVRMFLTAGRRPDHEHSTTLTTIRR